MSDGTPPGYTNDELADDGGSHDDIYQLLDPLDPRKVSLDIFEMYCHELVHTDSIGRMAYLMDKTKYMVTRIIGHQFPYGRLYNNTCIANIIARVCARQPYSNDDAPNADGYNLHLVDCLVDLPPEKWKKVISQFEELRKNLLRQDAALLVLPEELCDEEDDNGGDTQDELPSQNDSVNPLLESSQEFTQSYNKVLQSLKFHMCLSHIRPQFEKALQMGSFSEQKGSFADEEAVVIPYDDIQAFDNEIEEAFGDDGGKHAEVLNSLLVTTKKRGRLNLKKIDEIKDIYGTNVRLFDLVRLQNKLLHLIRRWSEMVLPVPELTQLGYGYSTPAVGINNKENISSLESEFVTEATNQQHKQKRRRIDESSSDDESEKDEEEKDAGDDDGEEEKEDNLDRLKRTRKALMNNVEDPLDDCVAKAKSARTRAAAQVDHNTSQNERKVSTPAFLKKKKNSYKIVFSDSEDDDVAGNVKGKAEGSKAGESKAEEGKAEEDASKMDELEDSDEENEGVKLSSVPERFKSAVPDKTAVPKASEPKKGKRRKKFTDTEDKAIRDGVAEFGAGNWSDIKSFYHIDLANRTAVQIKDRWRTLNK